MRYISENFTNDKMFIPGRNNSNYEHRLRRIIICFFCKQIGYKNYQYPNRNNENGRNNFNNRNNLNNNNCNNNYNNFNYVNNNNDNSN